MSLRELGSVDTAVRQVHEPTKARSVRPHAPGFLVRTAVGEDPREHHPAQRLRKYSLAHREAP